MNSINWNQATSLQLKAKGMRKISNQRGRPFKSSEVLSVDRTIKFAPSMWASLQERAAQTGVSMAEQIRRAISFYWEHEDIEKAAHAPPPKNQIIIELSDTEAQKIDALLSKLPTHYPDRTAFAANFIKRTGEKKPEEIIEFLVGDWLRRTEKAYAEKMGTDESDTQKIA